MGTVYCTKAAWPIMRAAKYGRIVVTTSGSGTIGNFGQSNYGAAKMAVVGFINVLRLEGARYNILLNAISPSARTRMTEDLMPEAMRKGHEARTGFPRSRVDGERRLQRLRPNHLGQPEATRWFSIFSRRVFSLIPTSQ